MIYSYMELSTANISPKTAMWLDHAVLNPENSAYLPVTSSEGCGYSIPVYQDMTDQYPDLPDDLKEIIRYAYENDCSRLILDRDAGIDENLTDYSSEWSDSTFMDEYAAFRKAAGLEEKSLPAIDKNNLTDQLEGLNEKLMDRYEMSRDCDMADAIDHIGAAVECIRNSDAIPEQTDPYPFTFTNEIRNRLQAYIENNFSPYPWPLIDNILQYTAAQGLNYNETVDLLVFLLDGIGLSRMEIETCLQEPLS